MTIAALFVDPAGIYSELPGVDCWGEDRDARLYAGPHPVVAHPPCHLWVNMAAVNWKRYQKQRPAWYPHGGDERCFESALGSVLWFGGVLEHPAFSHAWNAHALAPPRKTQRGWAEQHRTVRATGRRGPPVDRQKYYVCEVWQSAYGHRARKRTWLLYCGRNLPPELNWAREPGTSQIGWFDRNKPTLSKREANATPVEFRDVLIQMARTAIQELSK